MIIYPAIDIRGGKAVRLIEGDYNRETVFDADPLDAALRWQADGAEWIHIVDLDGARDGIRANANVIARIRQETTVKIQLGGGMRTMSDIDAAASLGIDRIVIGSSAVNNPQLVDHAVAFYGQRVAVGLDARDGRLATHGWTEQSDISAVEAGKRFSTLGVKHIVFTDIGRDGKLEGPNISALGEMIQQAHTNIIASGGVSSLDDLHAIKAAGAAGVIIGAALYHKRITLSEALTIGAQS